MQNRAYIFILITLMIDAIGIGLVFPIMPDLMDRVGAGGTGEGALWAGVLMASYAGALFIFAPIVGSLSDAYGRKPVLIVALFVLAIDYVIMALADMFWVLLIGRILAGVAGATYTTATAYIADISSKEDRSARFGMVGAAFGVGFVLGPAIGGIAAQWHITAAFWIAAAMSAANVVFGLFVLPESLPREKRRAFGRRALNPFSTIFKAFKIPGLAIPLICLFVFEFANMVYPTLWAFFTRELFGWSTLLIGVSLAGYGVMLAGVQAGLMPVLMQTHRGIPNAANWYRIRLDRVRRLWADFDRNSPDYRPDFCGIVRPCACIADCGFVQHRWRRSAGCCAGRHRVAVVHRRLPCTAVHDRRV